MPSLDSTLLSQLHESVSRALAEATAREQALTRQPASAPDLAWRHELEACEQRLGQFAALGDRAADKLRKFDQSLAEGEEQLRKFLTSAADFRRELATWIGRAID